MQQIFKGMDNGASTIDANFKELTSPSYSPTVANLTAINTTINGKLSLTSNQTTYSREITVGNWDMQFFRLQNIVMLHVQGDIPGSDWSNLNSGGVIIPAGYRPARWIVSNIGGDGHTGKGVVFNPDGTIYRRGSDGASPSGSMQTLIWATNDNLPS